MNIICPNCGYHHSGGTYAPEIEMVRLPRAEFDVMLRLRQAAGAVVTGEQLVDFLYGQRPDGGPDTALNCVQQHVCKARRKIIPLGWDITSERFRGYRLVRVKQ